MMELFVNKELFCKWSTFLGFALLVFPLGLSFYWGNVYVYTSSYIMMNMESEAQGPWIIAIKLGTTSLTACSSGVLSRFIGKRKLVFLGAVLNTSCFFIAYFAIQTSPTLFTIAFGSLFGLGNGLIVCVAMDFVLEWVDEKAGLVISLCRSGSMIGAVVANQFVSFYINPANEEADHRVGPANYFSQEDILNRVPSTFLYLGCGFMVAHVSGFLLLKSKVKGRSPLQEANPDGEVGYGSLKRDDERILINHEQDGKEMTKDSLTTSQTHGKEMTKDSLTTSLSHGKEMTKDSLTTSLTHGKEVNKGSLTTYQIVDVEDTSESENSLTTKQMLKTFKFYILFFSFFVSTVTLIVIDNYYKAFGQIRIHDDHLLTNVGSLIPVFGSVISIVWGVLMDKLGVKTSLIFYSAILAVLSVFYYSAAQLGIWFYCATTLFLAGNVSSQFSIFTISIVKSFGRTHQASNFGVFYLAGLGSMPASALINVILLNFGWFYVFFFTAFLNLVSLILLTTSLKP